MRRVFAILIATLAFTAFANAQVPPSGNIFLGYSYFNADTNSSNRANLNGWNGSLEGKIFPFVGIVADVGGYYGTQNLFDVCGLTPCSYNSKVLTATFGPRVSFSVGKFRPFAHALIGVGHTSGMITGFAGSGSDTSLADAFGGGIDYHLIPLIAWRFQADELQTRFFSATQNNFRFSTGVVFHF
ncbi:MAG TPA: outer membrane beta-barrel protein [Terriglobales bacterium]|jgi:hypothetical protein